MADINISQAESVPMTMHTRYVDMGDGTHAQMFAIALAPAAAIAVTGPLTDAELRATQVPVLSEASDSEAHVGEVGGRVTVAVQIPAITAGIYGAATAVGGILTFANMARVAGGSGVLTNFLLVDDAAQNAGLELWLFNQTFTAMVDQAAWDPSEADLENWIGTVRTVDSKAGYLTATGQSVVLVDFTLSYELVGTSLFGQLVTPVDTPTYVAADDITVKVAALQD